MPSLCEWWCSEENVQSSDGSVSLWKWCFREVSPEKPVYWLHKCKFHHLNGFVFFCILLAWTKSEDFEVFRLLYRRNRRADKSNECFSCSVINSVTQNVSVQKCLVGSSEWRDDRWWHIRSLRSSFVLDRTTLGRLNPWQRQVTQARVTSLVHCFQE